MNDESWYLNPERMEDRSLIDNLLAVKQAEAPESVGSPCPLHADRESLLWAYADDFLTEEEEEAAWEEIRQCRLCLERLAAVQRSLTEAEVWLVQQTNAEQLTEVRQAYERRDWVKVLVLGSRLRQLLPRLEEVPLMMQEAIGRLAAVPDIILAALDDLLKIHKPLPTRTTLGRAKPDEEKGKTINLLKEHCRVSLESELKAEGFELKLYVYERDEEKFPLAEVSVSLLDIYTAAELASETTTEEGLVTFTEVPFGNYLLLITRPDGSATDVISIQLQQDDTD